MASRPELAIIVPAYEAAGFLDRSLPALVAQAGAAPIVVVDAGSGDRTGEVARAHGAGVVRLPSRAGPAEARNAGARTVDAEVLLFVDADCVAHADVVERVRRAFRAEPDLVSLTGSYDAAPPDPGFFSQYMNLRHHHTHQIARREPATFWAGCGAVRAEAFHCAGGYDPERFPTPQIEDVELATRLRPLGRMRLDPDLQVTHLKRWTLRGVVETDIQSRAIPWTRLIAETGRVPDDLNLRASQRLAAALAPIALLSVLLLPWAVWTGRGTLAAVALLAVGASIAASFSLVAFFARTRGLPFATGAWLFHQIHLLYSAAIFVLLTARERLKRGRARR